MNWSEQSCTLDQLFKLLDQNQLCKIVPAIDRLALENGRICQRFVYSEEVIKAGLNLTGVSNKQKVTLLIHPNFRKYDVLW